MPNQVIVFDQEIYPYWLDYLFSAKVTMVWIEKKAYQFINRG